MDWSARVPFDEACRRAGGRRRWNSVRRCRADLRRVEVMRLVGRYGFERGLGADLARELGVSRATICRDLKLIRRLACRGLDDC